MRTFLVLAMIGCVDPDSGQPLVDTAGSSANDVDPDPIHDGPASANAIAAARNPHADVDSLRIDSGSTGWVWVQDSFNPFTHTCDSSAEPGLNTSYTTDMGGCDFSALRTADCDCNGDDPGENTDGFALGYWCWSEVLVVYNKNSSGCTNGHLPQGPL